MRLINPKEYHDPHAATVPKEVRNSDFGCNNCLYAGGDCKAGEWYKPKTAYDGQPSCLSYVYYD